MVKRPGSIALISAATLVLAACGGADNGSAKNTDQFEIFTWYTSGSEAAAKQVLFEGFNELSPDTEIRDGAVAGAGGTNAQAVLQSRLQGGDLPDAWQTYAGKALESYSESGLLMDLTQYFDEEDIQSNLPESVLEGITVDGEIQGVGMGVERGNILWYNVDVIEQAGLELTEDTSFEEFITDLEELETGNITPLCVGDTGGYGSRVLFEATMQSGLSGEQWNDLFDGDLSWESDAVTSAVAQYTDLLRYQNSDASSLDWTDALRKVGDGECAAIAMGGWAYGEFLNQGYEDGVDFDYVPFPGSSDNFIVISDIFTLGQDTNEELAKSWVNTVMDPDIQVEFSKEKGTVPTRTDADADELTPYSQWETANFRDDEVDKVYSLNGTSVAPPAFVQIFTDEMVTLNSNKDVEAFAKQMEAGAEQTE